MLTSSEFKKKYNLVGNSGAKIDNLMITKSDDGSFNITYKESKEPLAIIYFLNDKIMSNSSHVGLVDLTLKEFQFFVDAGINLYVWSFNDKNLAN